MAVILDTGSGRRRTRFRPKADKTEGRRCQWSSLVVKWPGQIDRATQQATT